MGLLDNLIGQSGNIDLGALGQQVGLDPDQVRQGMESMLGRITGGQNGDEAAAGAAADTGLSLESLQALLPALSAQLGEGGVEGLMTRLTGEGGLLSSLDRDGDGNPINDLAGMARGLFS
ncbi:MAG: hypothetical protein AB7H79_00090 [Sphingomonas sp.]